MSDSESMQWCSHLAMANDSFMMDVENAILQGSRLLAGERREFPKGVPRCTVSSCSKL